MKMCNFNNCTNKHDSHGYCANHARQFRKYGHPLTKEEISERRREIASRTQKEYYANNPDRPKRTWSQEARQRNKGVTKNTGRTHFQGGRQPWNKGLYGWRSGEDNPNWQGGKSTENYRIRRTKQYKKWRTEVFERDDYTCQFCEVRGVYLEADHIKPFAFYPDLRFEVSNGRTLCKECHMTTPTYKKHKLVEAIS